MLDNCARCMLLNHEASGSGSQAVDLGTALWDCGNMKVRFLDWTDSFHLLDGAERNEAQAMMDNSQKAASSCPSVQLDEKFPVLIGNEVMYEPLHAKLVAAVVAHKLQPGGCCLLCCAVRDLATFGVFKSECARKGLSYRDVRFELSGERGLMGKESDYEGGFLLMLVDFISSPFEGQWPDPAALNNHSSSSSS